MIKQFVRLTFASVAFIASTTFLLAQAEPPTASSSPPAPATEDLRKAKPVDPANNDPSVKPADDFFLYADGGWIKRTEIPPEYTRWGSFNQLIEQNNDALHTIAGTKRLTQRRASRACPMFQRRRLPMSR